MQWQSIQHCPIDQNPVSFWIPLDNLAGEQHIYNIFRFDTILFGLSNSMIIILIILISYKISDILY